MKRLTASERLQQKRERERAAKQTVESTQMLRTHPSPLDGIASLFLRGEVEVRDLLALQSLLLALLDQTLLRQLRIALQRTSLRQR